LFISYKFVFLLVPGLTFSSAINWPLKAISIEAKSDVWNDGRNNLPNKFEETGFFLHVLYRSLFVIRLFADLWELASSLDFRV
jgi:hypothetical protein